MSPLTASEIYRRLHEAYGQPRWWSDDPYIVMVQAVLVQNTAWTLVEKITNTLLTRLVPGYILKLNTDELEELFRPCGFSRRKALTIRRLTEWYGGYSFDVQKVKERPLQALRGELLSIHGIGAETADVLLTYAFHKPSFVIDAYTRRFLERLGFYFVHDEEIRAFFTREMKADYRLYGWYHWLILDHGILRCKKTPVCASCVFAKECAYLSACSS